MRILETNKNHNNTIYIQTSRRSLDWGSNLPARNTNFQVRCAYHYTLQVSSEWVNKISLFMVHVMWHITTREKGDSMSPTKIVGNGVTKTICPGFHCVINSCVDVCYMCVPLSVDPIWQAGYFIRKNFSISKKRFVHFYVSTCIHKLMQSDFREQKKQEK